MIIVSFLTDLIILRFFLICVFLSLFFRFVRCRPLRVCHKLYYIETGILYQRLPRDILSWFYDIVLGDTMGFGSVLPELKINRKCIAKVMSLIHVKPCVFLRSKLLFFIKIYLRLEIIFDCKNLIFKKILWQNLRFFKDSWDSRDFSSSLAQKNLESSQVAPNVVRYETNLKLDWQKLNPIRKSKYPIRYGPDFTSRMSRFARFKFECDKKDDFVYLPNK